MDELIASTLARLSGGTVSLTLSSDGVSARWCRNLGGLPSSQRSGAAPTLQRMLEVIAEHENLLDSADGPAGYTAILPVCDCWN